MAIRFIKWLTQNYNFYLIMQLFNLHTHTNFSDGKSTAEEIVQEAIRQGLKIIGFSDHSPVPFENTFAIRNDNVQNYVDTIKSLKEKYKDQIKIYCSMILKRLRKIMNSIT